MNEQIQYMLCWRNSESIYHTWELFPVDLKTLCEIIDMKRYWCLYRREVTIFSKEYNAHLQI